MRVDIPDVDDVIQERIPMPLLKLGMIVLRVGRGGRSNMLSRGIILAEKVRCWRLDLQ